MTERLDLAALLTRAIEEHHEQLNTSRIAQGASGRVEIDVNPSVNRVKVSVMLPEPRHATVDSPP